MIVQTLMIACSLLLTLCYANLPAIAVINSICLTYKLIKSIHFCETESFIALWKSSNRKIFSIYFSLAQKVSPCHTHTSQVNYSQLLDKNELDTKHTLI
jgi:hypothetical protein